MFFTSFRCDSVSSLFLGGVAIFSCAYVFIQRQAVHKLIWTGSQEYLTWIEGESIELVNRIYRQWGSRLSLWGWMDISG